MNRFLSYVSKYRKDFAKLFIALSLGFTAVMGVHFADLAKKPFWWNYWLVFHVVSTLIIVLTWLFFWTKKER